MYSELIQLFKEKAVYSDYNLKVKIGKSEIIYYYDFYKKSGLLRVKSDCETENRILNSYITAAESDKHIMNKNDSNENLRNDLKKELS